MPMYEYTCKSCEKSFELLLASRASKACCPHCGSAKLTRLFSTFAAHNKVSTPCSSGRCPSSQAAGSCAGGGCPFSR
ncbi:MAG: zinc ribbon domain-containing protein [Phycisphaerae bacterium]